MTRFVVRAKNCSLNSSTTVSRSYFGFHSESLSLICSESPSCYESASQGLSR